MAKYSVVKYILIISVALFSCKSSQQSASTSSAKNNMTDAQKADILFVFYNANKEKILGNLNNAADLFAEVIRKDGRNHAAMYELANIYAEQKKVSDALFFIRSAYRLDPKNSWYAISLADIYQKNKKFPEAAEVLGQLVKDFPDRVDYYFEWATALIFADKGLEAIKVYDKLEEKIGVTKDVIVQKERIYQRLGKNDKAVAEVLKLIAAYPKDSQAYGMLAELYQNLGQKQKALDTYNKVLEMDPNNAYIHLSLADYYRKNGEKEKSLEELKKAFANKELDVETKLQILDSYRAIVQLHPDMKEQAMEMCKILLEANPNEASAHGIYGDFLSFDKQYEKARSEYREAVRLGSKEFMVVVSILELDAQLNDYDALLKESEEAISNFPDQPTAYFYNGVGNNLKKKYNEAVTSLNSALKMTVDNKDLEERIYGALGDAYNELKQFAKSDESYEKALTINPKDSYILNNYAYYLSVRGEKLDHAEAMSKLSNELVINNSNSQDTYGWIFYKAGKYKEAKEWIEKALQNGSDKSATVLEHYGDILYKLGDTTKAFEYWQKAKDAGEGASEFLDKKLQEKKLFE